MDWTEFSKEDFSFPGNYRAIVEDNADPLKVGRVRVRIFGIHSLDPEETPVEHLPWAEPCLGMYYSGGQNLLNKEEMDNDRYLPKKDIDNSNIPLRSTESYDPEFVDNTMLNQGSGGYFTVPRKGTQVWIFFENGDHNRLHYWSIASKGRDWLQQKKRLIEEVQEKRNDIRDLRAEFTPDNEQHKGSSCSSNANVKVWTNKPKLEVFQIDDVENHYITSYTSDLGVTSIIVNEPGKERMYLIHKGFMEFVDENGQRKVLIGSSLDDALSFDPKDEKVKNKLKNDKEEMIANNYELHILGDFDIFVNSSTYIQCEKDVQINAKQNIGIVSRQADIDLVCDNADINMHTKGKTNINADDDIQIHTSKNMIIKTDGDLNWDIKGKAEFKVGSDIIFDVSSKYNVKSPAGFHVDAGGKFKIDPGGFGANVPMNAPVSNALHTGCFPGPGAGPATPYPGSPQAFASKPFKPGSTQKQQKEQPPAVTESGVDKDAEDLAEQAADTAVVIDTGGGTQQQAAVEAPVAEEEEEPIEKSQNTLDERLENQNENADNAIAENQRLAAEAEEAENAANEEEAVAKEVTDSATAAEEAEEARAARSAFEETGANNVDELQAAADQAKAEGDIEKYERLQAAVNYSRENNIETVQDARQNYANKAEAADAAKENATQKANQVNNINKNINSSKVDVSGTAEVNKLNNKDRSFLDRTGDGLSSFNNGVSKRAGAAQRNINRVGSKAAAIRQRANIRANVNLRGKTSFGRRILNNATVKSSMRVIDQAIRVLPNSRNAIVGTTRSISSTTNRLVGLLQMNNLIQTSLNINPESFTGAGALSGEISNDFNNLSNGLNGWNRIDSDITKDFTSVKNSIGSLNDVSSDNFRQTNLFSTNITKDTSFGFASAQKNLSRGWNNVGNSFKKLDKKRFVGLNSKVSNAQTSDIYGAGIRITANFSLTDAEIMAKTSKEMIDTTSANRQNWQNLSSTPSSLITAMEVLEEKAKLANEIANRLQLGQNVPENIALLPPALEELQLASQIFEDELEAADANKLVDEFFESLTSKIAILDATAYDAEKAATAQDELDKSLEYINKELDKAEISMSSGADALMSFSFNNLRPEKLGLDKLQNAYLTNPGKIQDIIENSLTELTVTQMLVEAIKEGITDEESGGVIASTDEVEARGIYGDINSYYTVDKLYENIFPFSGSTKELLTKSFIDILTIETEDTEDDWIFTLISKNRGLINNYIDEMTVDPSYSALPTEKQYKKLINFILYSLEFGIFIELLTLDFNGLFNMRIIDEEGAEIFINLDSDGNMFTTIEDAITVSEGPVGTLSGQNKWIQPDIAENVIFGTPGTTGTTGTSGSP